MHPQTIWSRIHSKTVFCGALGHFRILSKDNALPLVAFSLTKTVGRVGRRRRASTLRLTWLTSIFNVNHSHTVFAVASGHFRILSKDNALPLVAFSLTKTVGKGGQEEARQYTEFDLADKLRQRGWVLPAYTMAPDAR